MITVATANPRTLITAAAYMIGIAVNNLSCYEIIDENLFDDVLKILIT